MPTPTLTRLEDRDARYLRWIGGFNLLKGIGLVVLAFGLLRFLHKDVDVIVGNWISALRFDIENPHIAALLEKLDLVTDRQLKQLSGVTFVYAGLFLTEGTGLLLRQRWAKYFTVAMTASFVPIELFETLRHFGFLKLALLAANIAIVWFLVANLRRDKLVQTEAAAPGLAQVRS
jgi:uncharacterized membrane protein (DUF2068 family)